MLSDNPPPASTEPRAEPVSRLKKRWEIAARAPAGHFALFPDLPPLLVQVLYNRGLKEPGTIVEFLGADAPPADPFMLKGMGDAVVRLRRAIVQNEPIAVYGDYD